MRESKKKRNGILTSGRGIGLIEVALFIMTLGLVIIVAIKMADHRIQRQKVETTAQHVEMVEEAVKRFKAKNLRLPGPAPMDAAPDSARFGKEITLPPPPGGITDTTTAGATAGTNAVAVAARGNRVVRTGTVPVRSLNLSDEVMLDGWGNRLVYAVTQNYMFSPVNPADEATNPFNYDLGAISVVDSGGNSSSSTMGNVIYTVVAHGSDTRGAYSSQGVPEGACDNTNPTIGENCFSDNDGRFSNSMSLKGDTATTFAYQVKYGASLNLYNWWTDDPTWTAACVGDCNNGTQTRTVECRKGGKPGNVGFQFCIPIEPQNPNWIETRPCPLPPCTWNITSWGGCSAVCGNGMSDPTYHCERNPRDGVVRPPAFCGAAPAAQPCCTPCCGAPTGSCGGTYADVCGNAGACANPNTPTCGPAPGCGSGNYANSCGNNVCPKPACACTCGAAPGCGSGNYADSCGNNVCPKPACSCSCGAAPGCGSTYADSCGNNVCPEPACGCTCGAATGSCGGTYADSCGNAGACANPNTPTCGPAPGCGGTYADSCGNANACPEPACGPTCSDGIQNQGETGVDCGGPCPSCGGGGGGCGAPYAGWYDVNSCGDTGTGSCAYLNGYCHDSCGNDVNRSLCGIADCPCPSGGGGGGGGGVTCTPLTLPHGCYTWVNMVADYVYITSGLGVASDGTLCPIEQFGGVISEGTCLVVFMLQCSDGTWRCP